MHIKKAQTFSDLSIFFYNGTEGETRTRTPMVLDSKSSASTNSTTSAHLRLDICDTVLNKGQAFFLYFLNFVSFEKLKLQHTENS